MSYDFWWPDLLGLGTEEVDGGGAASGDEAEELGAEEFAATPAVVAHLEREGEGAMLHWYVGVTMYMRTGAIDTVKGGRD